MASAVQSILATQATRPETSDLSPRPRPVDEVAPHSPSSISQKPIPTASPSRDLSVFEKITAKLDWPSRIVDLAAAITASVWGALSLYAIKGGNDENDGAHITLINAQLDANALALLTYCSEHEDLPDCKSIKQNNSGISALLTRMATPIIMPGSSTAHTSASGSAPAPTKSLNLPSSTATSLPSFKDTPQYDPTGALLALLFAFCIACLFIWGCRASKKYSPSRPDEEKAIAQEAIDKNRDGPADSAVEERPNEIVA